MKQSIITVIGTTPDYVQKIYSDYPHPVMFVMDSRYKTDPSISDVPAVYCDLDNTESTLSAIEKYLADSRGVLKAVACFDCEALPAAAVIAERFDIKFLPLKAVFNARNKLTSRCLWKSAGLKVPDAVPVASADDALAFFERTGTDIVLKPLSGSGSELVFLCRDRADVISAAEKLKAGLISRRGNPFYRPVPGVDNEMLDPCTMWMAEAFIQGDEFSCDFILQDNSVTIIRESSKIKTLDQTFGSVLAYVMPPEYPDAFDLEDLKKILMKGAQALGYQWGHFMTDYIITDNGPVIIEMTPRPGGDSLPWLIMEACGMDIISSYLDFVSGNGAVTQAVTDRRFASVNIYAEKKGRIKKINTDKITKIPWVRQLNMIKMPGDMVTLPPEDYHNRLIGHCVIRADNADLIRAAHETLRRCLIVEME